MRFIQVAPHNLVSVWAEVTPWLERALKRNTRYDVDDVKGLIFNGSFQLWLAVDSEIQAVCVTELLQYPQEKWARVLILTGRKRGAWQGIYKDTIEKWAKAEKCTGVESFARKGWARVFKDYSLTHVMLEKRF